MSINKLDKIYSICTVVAVLGYHYGQNDEFSMQMVERSPKVNSTMVQYPEINFIERSAQNHVQYY